MKNATYQVDVIKQAPGISYIHVEPEPKKDIAQCLTALHKLHQRVDCDRQWILCLSPEAYQTHGRDYHLPYPGSHWNLNWHQDGWRYELEIGVPVS